MPDSPSVLVGVDWASQEHQVCALRPDGELIAQRVFRHSGAGLCELTDWLTELSGGSPETVYVAIEVPHGPVVETLLERHCQVFSINPKQLDRFRDRHFTSGAKDDSRDALVLADSLRTDRRLFRHLAVEDPDVLALREWLRMREELMGERVQEINRLRDQLRRYYPQSLELTQDVTERWFLKLLRMAPTPQSALELSQRRVSNLLKTCRIRRIGAKQVLETLRQLPISLVPGVIDAASAHVELIIDRIELLSEQIHKCDKTLDALLAKLSGPIEEEEEESDGKEQRDAVVLRSLPGVGRIVLATLLAEAPQAVRDRDYHALRALSGVAPVTRRSGKKIMIVMRRACQPRLREACHHWARCAIQKDPASRALYDKQRARGNKHHRALRSVADRLMRIAISMLRSGTLYEPDRAAVATVRPTA